LVVVLAQQLVSEISLARFAAPANNGNEVRFYDHSGFIDEDLTICAKTAGRPEQRVLHFVSFGYAFSSAEWTKDGQVVAVEMAYLPNDEKGSNLQHAWVIAYDFSTGRALAPAWLDIDRVNQLSHGNRVADWRGAESQVLAVVAAHGGLAGPRLTSLERHHLWRWQTPEYQKS